MGGNALKEYETTRLSAAEYKVLVAEFSAKFREVFGFEPVLILAYRNKPSFGDADYLVESELLPPNWTEVLVEGFGLSENQFVKNSDVLSIGWNHFQIDLIVTAKEHMAASFAYFSYNDFGNLIGRILHKTGLKVGHKGISLVIRPTYEDTASNNHIIKEIFVSRNVFDAFDILGLDLDRYNEGFDELEDIFKFVASSKYFDPEIYALEHRSATSRIRDKKRATYNAFLRWVDETKPKANHNFESKSELGGYSIRMPYYETEVLRKWPWVDAEVKSAIAEFEFERDFKQVLNGQIVQAITGLEGPELGGLMARIKSVLTKESKQRLMVTPELIRPFVESMYSIYRNKK